MSRRKRRIVEGISTSTKHASGSPAPTRAGGRFHFGLMMPPDWNLAERPGLDGLPVGGNA
ncbi:hypothetical protein CCGE531_15250 [Rhizobium sp. CCGE531]|nr:hypothetical protein CCGE531_15250 [Rhizobium sp. CCGE531]AYG73596.1 hypothetical protein CCGE532_14665 [Rhizobium sp. CCGE532]